MIFVDSNIWCYYFDGSAEEHEPVSQKLEDTVEEEDIVVNTVVFLEVSHYLIKNLGPIKGKDRAETLLEYPLRIVDFDVNLMRESLSLLSEYAHAGIGGRDATILATMKKLDLERLMTHDRSFSSIDFVEFIDPAEV